MYLSDVTLQPHLDTANANATYLGKESQRNINARAIVDVQKMVERIRAAKFFSLFLDEKSDVLISDQCSCMSTSI